MAQSKRNTLAGVYKITNPNGRVYIGSSVNIHKRFNEYKKLRCVSQKKTICKFD